jgi:hypothetical protein
MLIAFFQDHLSSTVTALARRDLLSYEVLPLSCFSIGIPFHSQIHERLHDDSQHIISPPHYDVLSTQQHDAQLSHDELRDDYCPSWPG